MSQQDQDILTKLRDEQKTLIIRLKAIRNAIIGLGGEVSNEDFQSLLMVDEDVPLPKLLFIPPNYDKTMPQIQKIAFALKELGGEAYVAEIANKLMELEGKQDAPEEEKAILRRNTTLLTSYLYRDNRLKVKKDGNRYRYGLIE